MTYLTYEEYINKGGTLDAATFNKHIDFADSMIKNRTYGRIEKMKIIPEEAKNLCREIVDFAERIKGDGSKVTSKRSLQFQKQYEQIVLTLLGTTILSRLVPENA